MIAKKKVRKLTRSNLSKLQRLVVDGVIDDRGFVEEDGLNGEEEENYYLGMCLGAGKGKRNAFEV